MLERLHSALNAGLGLDLPAKDIATWQMSLRAVIVFLLATGMIRLGNKRFMGQSTALDVVLGIVFGSVLSRAITGNAPFYPSLAAALTLVLLHWLLAMATFYSPAIGGVFKGKHRKLVQDGQIDWKAMKRSHITEADLREALRGQGEPPDVSRLKSAHLERNGDISVLL